MVLLCDHFDVLSNGIGRLKTLADFKIEVTKVKWRQVYVLIDLLDFLIIVPCVQSAIVVHLRVPFISTEPFFEGLCFLVDVYSCVLSLMEKLKYFSWVLFVLECYIVVVAIRKEFALIRLNLFLLRFDKLHNILCSVHLPENVLNNWMVSQHWQDLQVILMLTE